MIRTRCGCVHTPAQGTSQVHNHTTASLTHYMVDDCTYMQSMQASFASHYISHTDNAIQDVNPTLIVSSCESFTPHASLHLRRMSLIPLTAQAISVHHQTQRHLSRYTHGIQYTYSEQ